MAGPSGNETNHTLDGLTIRGGLALMGDAGVVTYLNKDVAAHVARVNVHQRKQGFFAETVARSAASIATVMVTGSVYGCSIGLLAGDVVTNILSMCSVLGSGFSGVGVKFGIYDRSQNLLAQTADVSASFASAGSKVCPLTAPYTILADDAYFLAAISIASTPPTLWRGAAGTGIPNTFTTGSIALAALQTGQTDLPAAATMTAGFSSLNYWLGVA